MGAERGREQDRRGTGRERGERMSNSISWLVKGVRIEGEMRDWANVTLSFCQPERGRYPCCRCAFDDDSWFPAL